MTQCSNMDSIVTADELFSLFFLWDLWFPPLAHPQTLLFSHFFCFSNIIYLRGFFFFFSGRYVCFFCFPHLLYLQLFHILWYYISPWFHKYLQYTICLLLGECCVLWVFYSWVGHSLLIVLSFLYYGCSSFLYCMGPSTDSLCYPYLPSVSCCWSGWLSGCTPVILIWPLSSYLFWFGVSSLVVALSSRFEYSSSLLL